MIDFLLTILFFIIGIVLGFYLLLLGRRTMWLTTAIICLAGTGGLLALIFLDESSGWALTEARDWTLIGITVAAGVIGGVIGARAEHIAAGVVGFFAGGYIGLWLYSISYYIIVTVALWPEQTAFWVGVAILIVGGLLGLFLTRRSEAIAIILISVFVGADIVGRALSMDPSKSITAVVLISLALLGLVVQYAQYLREVKAEVTSPFAASTSAAPAPEYFDLSDD
jgi:hypothetical protein